MIASRHITAIYFLIVITSLLLCASPVMAQLLKIESPQDSTLSYRDRIAVIARGQSGLPLTLIVNGTEVNTLQVRSDNKADFLNVAVPPGPVVLRIEQKMPNGQTFTDSVKIHVIGPAAKILLDIHPQTLPADSLSIAEAKIHVIDEWGMPLPDGQIVSIKLDNGTIITPDIYPDKPGTQIQVQGGYAVAQILSPSMVGDGYLGITADGVAVEERLNYTIPTEKMTIVGMATGQIGWRKNKPAPDGVAAGSAFRKGTYTEGKAAVYAQGNLGKGFVLSTSYDTNRKYNDHVFQYLTPGKVYPIYGDASSIFYEAPSASKFFARLAKNQSYIQYGDFATNLTRNELSAYNRSFTGISSDILGEKTSLTIFGSSTEQTIQVDEIPGEGVSGHYYLSASRRGIPIVEGSEQIVIQARDRLHPELVQKEERQYRFTDYEIDYEQGTLLFKRPVPSNSPEENPIIILATYETAWSTERRLVGGGRAAFHHGNTFEVGATLVGEEHTGQDYWLTGLDTKWQPFRKLTLISEVSRSSEETEGWAWKLGTRGNFSSSSSYDLYYREVEKTFFNPNSPTAQPGSRKIRGRMAWSPVNAASLSGEAFQMEDTVNNEDRSSVAAGGNYRWKNLLSKASVELTRLNRQGRKIESTILNTGFEWTATKKLTFGAERDQTFGDEDMTYRPTLNRLNARWKLTDKLDLVGEHAFRDVSFTDSTFTALGIQSMFSDDLTAYAKYNIDGVINGQQNQAIVGLRHRFRPNKDLTFHTTYERMHMLRGDSQRNFYAYSLAGEYLPPEALKASARFEQRNGKTLDKLVASGAIDFSVARDLSLLGKHTYLDEERTSNNTKNDQRSHHFISGLAYRALSHDYLNALGKYEYKYDYNSFINPTIIRSNHIGSLEMILEPRSQIEWFVRYAFKVSQLTSEEITTETLTDLWMSNIRFEWHQSVDILGEYRLLVQHSTNDYRHGAAFEVGYIIKRNTRIASGYNFVGYHDEDFAGKSYW
ncbi:hypothetical protein ACFL47_05340, partial [Candidatus Latescibacterota bacterium]